MPRNPWSPSTRGTTFALTSPGAGGKRKIIQLNIHLICLTRISLEPPSLHISIPSLNPRDVSPPT